MPIVIFLRNRLKYALTYHEVKMILKQRQVCFCQRHGPVEAQQSYACAEEQRREQMGKPILNVDEPSPLLLPRPTAGAR